MKKWLLYFLALVSFASAYAQADTSTIDVDIPNFTLSELDVGADEMSQDVSGLLQSSSDIFVSKAGYTFGPARFRIRGYDSRNLEVFMDGVRVNDLESGRAYWGSWGGLNDAVRDKDIKTGIVSSEWGFGGLGGVTSINTRASAYRKQIKFSYAIANRSYRNRAMFHYATGETASGWSLVLSGSRRWAQEGYSEGTFYDAWSYFISAEKKINRRHAIGLTVFASPTKKGRNGMAIQEAYDLTGTNYYNPYWGYQNGEKRNARVSNYNQPMLTLTHYYNISEKTKAQGSVSYWSGRGGSTALNWVEADDPRPDYYKYFPSYANLIGDVEQEAWLTNKWQNDEKFRQVNWDHFYFANSKFLNTVNNVEGIEGNDVTGLRSKYIVEDRRNDKNHWMVNWHIHSAVSDNLSVSGGLNLNWFKVRRFKEINDLLGGQYWLDIDKYAAGEPFEFPIEAQNDLNHPNRLVGVGDIFGYDYFVNINKYSGFAQADFTYSKVDFYAGLNLSHTTFWRKGNMRNGRFPDNSYGDGDKHSFFNYGLKAGATYKINGRNYITVNGLYMTRAPYFRDSYVSARTRDIVVDGLKSETIYSGDVNYIVRSPIVKARLTLYYTKFQDQAWSRSFYHDVLQTFVNYLMTGVDKVNTGAELGAEVKLSPTFTLSAVASKNMFIYDSRPVATIVRDNDEKVIDTDRKIYLENYYVGGMPQTVASLGIKYSSPKYWFVQLSGNYMADAYLDPNPDRRTEEAISGFVADDVRVDEVLYQQKLDPGMTLDIFGGKSWQINYKYYIGFTLSVNNILDNQDYTMFGYEQFRYNPENISKFPPKYAYMYGRNYFLNVYFRM